MKSFCSSCQKKTNSKSKIRYWNLPKVLVVQLKSFATLYCNNAMIQFEEE